ncbi:MAG: hypothetical protein WD906_01760 [Anaerolineales bacterium]
MLSLPLSELIGTIAAALLTLMVLSYLLGDNVLFRIAVHIFVGVAAGYAGATAWRGVLEPALIEPIRRGGLTAIFDPLTLIPVLLILMLLLKLSPATARAGGLPLALLVGVAAAVTVGGAISGTVLPQAWAAAESLSPTEVSPLTGETGLERTINVAIVLLGTLGTLFYFRFAARRSSGGVVGRPALGVVLASVGQVFLALTFGAMFAGAISASLVVLAERVQFVWGVVGGLLAAGTGAG